MIGSRVYMHPRNYILNTIHDVKEIQNGKGTYFDMQQGKVNFLVRLYHAKWEYQFTVTEIGVNRCSVEIGIGGDVQNKEDKIRREFALFDSMLAANTEIELEDKIPSNSG
jgi:hypothetical protein